MKRLIRKAEIYDGFDYKDIYYEVYKNPTASEIQAVKKADTYSSIRGVIDQNGDKYIWIGEMGHYSINRYINNQIPTNYFRFAYSNYWIIDLKRMGANIDSNECKKIIKDNLDFLSQIGNINSPVDIMGLTDRNYSEFNSIKDFLNENNEKTAEIYDGINRGGNYYEIFKNPTSSEISLFKNNIRGAIDRNNNIYIWDGSILHFQTSPQIPLDYFRFAIDGISMYCHMSLTNNITLEQCQSVIEKNISYFSQMIDLNNKPLELYLSNGEYSYNSINDFLDLDLKLKEKTAEIYDGFDYKDKYYEVYKNPTVSEIEAVKKSDPYNGVRGVIDKNGDKYIWIAEMGHANINRYINNQIPTDYFRFAYSNYWFIFLRGMGANIDSNECKKIIKDNLDFLSQIGNINSPVDVFGLIDEDNYLEFNSINDFLSNRKVIAIEQKLNIGDQVQWKRHPYDTSTYEVMEVLPNGNVFIDNGINAFTDIKQSVLKFIKRSAE